MNRTRRVLLVMLAALLATIVLASPASAYVHEANCQAAQRGASLGTGIDLDHDDDIHAFGVRYGLPGFLGFGGTYRVSSQNIYVHEQYRDNSTAGYTWAWGRCYQSGSGDDWIVDYVTWTLGT